MYIRKNRLTIGEEIEIYEIVSDDGATVEWFGTEIELTKLLRTPNWNCGDSVVKFGPSFRTVL